MAARLTTFVVVAFSLFVQGLTMPALVKRLGILRGADETDVAERSPHP